PAPAADTGGSNTGPTGPAEPAEAAAPVATAAADHRTVPVAGAGARQATGPAVGTSDATRRPGAQRPAPATRPRNAPPANATAPSRESRPTAAPATGVLQLAISPWGHVEVNGRASGTTPPLTRLALREGRHTVTVRNEDFPAYTVTVQVQADKPVTVRHRFGP
ncbi:MAG: PEGA domain-containing protein, partial [Rubrivivax sp.]|nr:PEGA domain-containing protein [Rubrivivax sp.]